MGKEITCLCPTYGRFESLRDVVACFLLQDCTTSYRALLILNDAPVAIQLFPEGQGETVGVNVVNSYGHMGGHQLWEKRRSLLEMASSRVVAHWDDDDLYLPWHLSQCVEQLDEETVWCVKPHGAWFGVGPRGRFEMRGVHHNVFEGQMVFFRERAEEVGGYSEKASGQARDLLERFRKAKKFSRFECAPFWSYIYRWGNVPCHVSAAKGDNQQRTEEFAKRNCDFGDGETPLIERLPAREWAIERLTPQFDCVRDGMRAHADKEPGCMRAVDRLDCYRRA